MVLAGSSPSSVISMTYPLRLPATGFASFTGVLPLPRRLLLVRAAYTFLFTGLGSTSSGRSMRVPCTASAAIRV